MVFISHQFSSKNNGSVLLCQTRFRHRNCFLSRSVSTDGKDEHVLKIEKNGPVLPDKMIFCSYLTCNSTGTFFDWVEAVSNITLAQN